MAKLPLSIATHQQIGNAEFGPMFAQANNPFEPKAMVPSTPSPLTLESPVSAACYLSAEVNQPVAFGTSATLTGHDGDSTSRASFWGNSPFVPFDLHPSPTSQQDEQQFCLHNQNLYSPLTKPASDSSWRKPTASLIDDDPLSSLLEDDDRFMYRANATAPSDASRAPAMTTATFSCRGEVAVPVRMSATVKPQSGVWEQSAANPTMTSSAIPQSKDDCNHVSPTAVELKLFVADNELQPHSSANACASSRLSASSADAATWREPIPFYAQQPPFLRTPSVDEASPFSGAMPAASMGTDNGSSSPFRQYAANSTSPPLGYSQQQQMNFQSARQLPLQSTVNAPACQYIVAQPTSSSTPSEAEQWRRQLMLRRSNAVAPFGGMAFAAATSTPPATSGVGCYSRTSGLAVHYHSPANKRARVPSPQLVGYNVQTAAGTHRLVPPPPVPLQNGVDGVHSPLSVVSSEGRTALVPPTALWQGFPGVFRPSFLPAGPATAACFARTPPPPLFTRPPPRQIGIYSPQERRERIRRFHEKREQRVFHKRVKYDCRKRLANACPRIKGRFVRRDEYLAAVESGQRVTHPHSSSESAAAD